MVDKAELHLSSLEKTKNPQEIEVINPATGAVIGTVPNCNREEVAAAAERARQAQPAWAAMPVQERAKVLKRFGDLLVGKRQADMVRIMRQENGKAKGPAMGETFVIATFAGYYAKNAAKWLQPERRLPIMRGLYTTKVHRKPLGVMGNISPWNYPLILSMMDVVPALVAGNAVILKPSEITPFTSLEAAKLWREAGLPENVFQVVTGYGETGANLVDFVDFIMFTGSTATGRKVAARAAERLIPYSLELGGNGAMLVLQDADIDKAAANAVSVGFENSGQACVSIQRVLVEAPVYDQFLQAAKKWHSRLNMGSEDSFDTHIGSLTNERELQRVKTHIQDAVDKGATIVAGGNPRPDLGPWFHEPTILTNSTPDMLVMNDEVFGPLIMVTKVGDVEEAIGIANSTCYGLSATIWSKNVKRAEQLALRIETGDVNINCSLVGIASPDLEFGGVKNSGVGRRNGKQGLLKYTVSQSVVWENFPLTPDAPTPYTARILNLLRVARTLKRWLPFIGS